MEVQGQGEGGFLALLPKLQSLKTKGVYPNTQPEREEQKPQVIVFIMVP